MTRVFTNAELIIGDEYLLSDSDSHHLKNVLRVKEGNLITIVDGRSNEYTAKILETHGKNIKTSILSKIDINREPKLNVTVFQGLPKGDKLEQVIMRGTEIGANSFVPVTMKRSVVVIKDKKANKKHDRWQKIADSAASQSRRQIIPEVKTVHSFTQMIGCLKDFERVFVLYENEENKSIYDYDLTNLKGNIAIVVGPEGGFEDIEIEFLKKVNSNIITLGPRILRTETAALNLLSVLLYCSGDMRR